jgi:hypothetical protein
LTHSGQNEELEQDLPLEKMKLNPRESKLVAVARDWTEKKQREILTEEESERPNSALFLAETSEQIRAEGVKPVGHDRIQGDGPKSAWAEAKRTSDSLRRRKRWQAGSRAEEVIRWRAPQPLHEPEQKTKRVTARGSKIQSGKQRLQRSWALNSRKNQRPAFDNETRPPRLHTDGLRRSLRNESEIQSMTCTGPREQRASGQNLAGSSTRTAPNEP